MSKVKCQGEEQNGLAEDKSGHIPVMVNQVIELLNAKVGGSFVDCTLGNGGHSVAILSANQENSLIGIDRDMRAIERATKRLVNFGGRFKAQKAKFSEISSVLKNSVYDGVLADLGMSTNQLEENRGFAFDDPAPLNMRMDESDAISALEIVSTSSEQHLFRIFKEGGVGMEARAAARTIVKHRPFESTKQFSQVLNRALAGKSQGGNKRNPCTVIFQALRMAVNNELWELTELMQSLPKIIRDKGRAVVICFHSLEDKIVARTMRTWEQGGEFSASYPGSKQTKPLGRLITRKAITPSDQEVAANPASRSARLRAFEFSI